MKRRGTSRRQVLDLETNSSSPKRSWQTKYQQICMDHLNSSNSTPEVHNGSTSPKKKLPQLVGYVSDSDSDEPKTPGDIDSKVEDFIKEVSDVVPKESSNQEKTAPMKTKTTKKSSKTTKTKPVIGPMPANTMSGPAPEESAQLAIAWQECYDENSGCCYYWNTVTNEVTWDIPQELQANHLAMEQWKSQQVAIAQKGGGLVPMYMDESPKVMLPTQQQQKKQNTNVSQEKTKNKQNTNVSQEKTKNKRLKSNSDSEDEKIELITSYGPNSDEDSDSSSPVHVHTSKKKKCDSSKSTSKKKTQEEFSFGPQLPPDYIITQEMDEKEPAPPGVENDSDDSNCRQLPLHSNVSNNRPSTAVLSPKHDEKNSVEVVNSTVTINTEPVEKKASNLQRLKKLMSKDYDSSSSSSSSSEESDSSSNEEKEKSHETDDNEDDDDIEDSILERLKNQAKILQELGGEIPEEIKELLEPPTEVAEEKPSVIVEQEEFKADLPVIDITDKTEELKKPEITEESKELSIEITKKTEDLTKIEITEKSEEVQGVEEIDVNVEVNESNSVEEIEQVMENNINNNLNSNTDNTELEEILLKEKAPTSFSLIAGYGNEDDSEIEDDKADDKPKDNEKPTPLFPIVHNEKDKVSTKSVNLKVIKLSAKAKELIHSSATTERARATDFVTTPEGLRPSDYVAKETPVAPNIDKEEFIEPVKKVSRKKRLEVPVIIKPEKSSVSKTCDASSKESTTEESNTVVLSLPEKPDVIPDNPPVTTPYTSAWEYNSELDSVEHRGFGYSRDCNFDQKTTFKKGKIQFIKSDILMPKAEPVISVQEKKQSPEEIKPEDEATKIQREQTTELARVISEKVKFLIEGKEAVPPVQVMAIQLETLMAALDAGGLCIKYLLEWLTSLDIQLANLEKVAAPQGWQCLWDRSYKGYYYRNVESGTIQWEYPTVDIPAQGGEEAMELCDSPPPSATAQPPPPPPLATTPPPPVAPPPPRISSHSPSPDLVAVTDDTPPPLPPLPPPPPVISEQPPLPPLPPSESPPPPPLPPSPPPPPPPPIISSPIDCGEPLPPGVDISEELFVSIQPPLPVVPLPVAKTPPPPPPPPEITESVEPVYSMDYSVATVPMHYDPYQMQAASEYSGNVYQTETVYNPIEENYVIARPPASNPVTTGPSLATELDSFYSEVAALDPPPPPPAPSPSPPPPPPPSSPPTQVQPAEPTKKRKKTKLAPGLALKKKGVSSLVAKWQQVQQDVRREEESEKT